MSISRPAALVGVALLAGLLTGCTPPPPVTGVVVEKDYDAAESTRSCTTSKKKCRLRSTPADWDVTLRTASGEEVEVEVSQAEFDRLQVGDTFTSR